MTAYMLTSTGSPPKLRLESSRRIDAMADFDAIARELAAKGLAAFRARKISYVAARQATAPVEIETRYNGKESRNQAAVGDWIVTNMTLDRQILRDAEGCANTYVVPAANFPRLYDRDGGSTEFGDVYKAKGVVDALPLPGGFDIVAPWGERQQGVEGYLLRNGADVYGIHAEAFAKTYERLP